VLRVSPRKGDGLLFFPFVDGAPDHDAVHGGCAVRRGVKWVAQLWFTLGLDAGG
jgi:prolyl 4-hydroxylase